MAIQDSTLVSITGGSIAGTGTGLTALNGSNISSGTVPPARLGSGVPSSATFLRGDSAWSALTIDIPYDPVDKSANFTAVINTFYNLIGAGAIITLPTVVGIGGRRIGLILKADGSWTLDPDGSETILGETIYTFDWGQFACIVLKADANNGKWDIE